MIPSEPVLFWKYFDAISLGVLVVVIGSLVIWHYRKTGSLLSSISKTVAYSPRSSLIFSIVMTVFFPLYYAFLWFWVGPLLQMPAIFYILLLISAICEMIFVWMPARGKTNSSHIIAAGLVGLLMFILPVLIIAYSSDIKLPGSIGLIGFLVIGTCAFIALVTKKLGRHTFQIEVIYCTAFLMAMSLIAHT